MLLANWRIGGYLGVVGLEKWWFRQQQLEVPQGVDIPRGKMISIGSHWVLVVVVLLCWVPIGYTEITHRLGIIVDLYMGCPCTWSSMMWCESDFSAWQLGDCPLSEELCKCFVRSFWNGKSRHSKSSQILVPYIIYIYICISLYL